MPVLPPSNRIIDVSLPSWRDFSTAISADGFLSVTGSAIWRGQSSACWSLETSFDRAVRKSGEEPTEHLAQLHLARFKRAARGRRVQASHATLSDDEWWTLGQHYGLATPMLDWTYAPYVALYFSFLDPVCADPTGMRAVWAVNVHTLRGLNARAAQQAGDGEVESGFRILDPLVDENARLVNQNGVFTRGPVGVTVDGWVQKARWLDVPLVVGRVRIPDGDRENCLRHLNSMNINHATLFPDIEGASRYCNHQLTIKAY